MSLQARFLLYQGKHTPRISTGSSTLSTTPSSGCRKAPKSSISLMQHLSSSGKASASTLTILTWSTALPYALRDWANRGMLSDGFNMDSICLLTGSMDLLHWPSYTLISQNGQPPKTHVPEPKMQSTRVVCPSSLATSFASCNRSVSSSWTTTTELTSATGRPKSRDHINKRSLNMFSDCSSAPYSKIGNSSQTITVGSMN